MTYNSKDELMDDATGPLVITWTANEPTAALTQTIADGTVPTVAELGQFAQNINTIVTDIVAVINA